MEGVHAVGQGRAMMAIWMSSGIWESLPVNWGFLDWYWVDDGGANF